MPIPPVESQPRSRRQAGFTLVELLVAAAIFTVVSAAAFSLMAQHQPIFNQQQNLAEVNIALRNAVAQMQLDLANAGQNYLSSTAGTSSPIDSYPIGVTITNNVVSSGVDCRTGTPPEYTASCFDQMSIISIDSSTPVTNPVSSTGYTGTGSSCIDTTTGTAYLTPNGSTTGYGSGAAGLVAATAAASHYQYSASFQDQVLFVKNDNSAYTTAKLAAAPTTIVIGGNYYVKLTYGATGAGGLNTSGWTGNDPYNLATNTPSGNLTLTNSFCAGSIPTPDFVLRIAPITYKVDLTNPNNPALLRIVAGLSGQTTATETLATQIIGFKIGASLLDGSGDTTTYCFDSSKWDAGCPTAATTGDAFNYPMVRTIMVSLIGRTNPNPDPTYVFRNTFDGGPYEIQGVTVIVNPRNMSSND